MIDLLSLPEKYKVNKIIDKQSFIKKANLTPAERKKVESFLSSIKILYDVNFSDSSELIFLELSIKYMMDKFTVRHIARCIAASIPHKVILFAHCPKGTQLIVFQGKSNKFNSFRTSIISFICSPYFDYRNPGYITKSIFEELSNISNDYHSADDCNQAVFRFVLNWREGEFYNEEQRDKVAEELIHRNEILRIMDNNEYDVDSGSHYYWRDNSEQKRFVLDCCYYCYGLYLEYATNELFVEFDDEVELDEESWLINYVDACNELARLSSCDDLNPVAIRMIKNCFDTKEDYHISGYDPEYFDDVELREILDDFYERNLLMKKRELWELDDEDEEIE